MGKWWGNKEKETNTFHLLLVTANSWQILATGTFPKESLFPGLDCYQRSLSRNSEVVSIKPLASVEQLHDCNIQKPRSLHATRLQASAWSALGSSAGSRTRSPLMGWEHLKDHYGKDGHRRPQCPRALSHCLNASPASSSVYITSKCPQLCKNRPGTLNSFCIHVLLI